MLQPQTTRRAGMSLRRRVTLLAACCVAGAVALVSLGAYLTMRDSMYDELDNQLVERAEAAVQTPPVRKGFERIPGAFLTTTDVDVGVLTVEGELDHPPNHAPPWGQPELAVAAGTSSMSLRTDEATDTRVVAVGGGPGEAMVLAQSLGPTKENLGRLAVVLFVISGAGVVVAALAGTAVARGGLAPVERLTAATERVAVRGDLRPIPVTGDDELGRLTHSFNMMLGAVADSQERQRQLVADAGHELRTPLTSLRTNLELLLAADRAGHGLSAVDRAEIEADIRAQLDEVTQLIGDLELLSRAQAPSAALEPVDMAEVVGQAVDRARRRAGEVRFDVALQPWQIVGDATALERAVLNLLDNAVKFAPDGSTVTVRMHPSADGMLVIDVGDAGPGIAEADLPKVFERFYRSSEARTMPGSGLGLAIVKQSVERHGGTVGAGRSELGGALLSIRLPAAPSQPTTEGT